MANLLYQCLFAKHENNTQPLMVFPNGGTLSYKDFLALSRQIANLLVSHGVAHGDRVAVQVEKSPEALVLYAACIQTGAIFLPLNTAYTETEMAYFLKDATPKIVVGDPEKITALEALAKKHGGMVFSLDGNGAGSLLSQASEHSEKFLPVACAADDLASILYTSGTTGRPKGAMLSHKNLATNAQSLMEAWQYSPNDRLLHALPIFHIHGLFVAGNLTFLSGASMIFLPRFDLDGIINCLGQATTMMGVPTFYTRLLNDPRFTQSLVGHMRLFVSGSAPLLAETHRRFEERTGHKILERYGMTETNMTISNPYGGKRKAGTVGQPLPGVLVRITHQDNGLPVADGEIGMLEVSGENVFRGYWQMPEKTAEEFRDDGYFITGDLACLDGEGYYQIVGRGKDMIISGGFNVYPKEVETCLDDLDSVLESAVFGVPHPDFGEGVVAVVVLDQSLQQASPPTEANLKTDIANKLAKFKQPKRIFVIDALPRNTMGKVQKNKLRLSYADLFS